MVEEELEQMIRRREFAEGEQLPSERPGNASAFAVADLHQSLTLQRRQRFTNRRTSDVKKKTFCLTLAVSRILNSCVCFLSPVWFAMPQNTPAMVSAEGRETRARSPLLICTSPLRFSAASASRTEGRRAFRHGERLFVSPWRYRAF
jgi:hypothetical protein